MKHLFNTQPFKTGNKNKDKIVMVQKKAKISYRRKGIFHAYLYSLYFTQINRYALCMIIIVTCVPKYAIYIHRHIRIQFKYITVYKALAKPATECLILIIAL